MALNGEIAAFLDLIDEGRQNGRPALHQLPLEEARAAFERSSRELDWPRAGAVEVEPLVMSSRDGQAVPLRLYRPEGQEDGPLPVLLYFHGGGYVLGSLDSHAGVCEEFAACTPCAVLAVGYRLAPEWPFPTAVEDAEDALHFLIEQAPALNLDITRLALAGDSAGGGLAAMLAQRCAQGAFTLPCAPLLQLLCYPITDASCQRGSTVLFDQGYLLESETLEWFYQHYLPRLDDRRDPRASPLLASTLRGVCPALVAVAGFDPLLDEGLAYAERLRDEGVDLKLLRYDSLTHDFLRMGQVTGASLAVFDELTRALGQALAGPSAASG